MKRKGKQISYVELIARQQLEIANLKASNKTMNDNLHKIYNICYCIGGPLNDNKLQYTRGQMKDFYHIIRLVNEVIIED